MVQHLNVRENSDPNKLGARTETGLPFVNGNLQNINMVVNKMDVTVKQLSQDVNSMTQDFCIDLVDIREEINDNVREHIRVMKNVFKEEIGKSSLLIHD